MKVALAWLCAVCPLSLDSCLSCQFGSRLDWSFLYRGLESWVDVMVVPKSILGQRARKARARASTPDVLQTRLLPEGYPHRTVGRLNESPRPGRRLPPLLTRPM